mmetsp:Transcript_52349/g.139403  ORF Transcript_52349/g.139403 Transcript_52349/m.139403 type:complete len:204 (+) Transcript_52349:602-1213(+)
MMHRLDLLLLLFAEFHDLRCCLLRCHCFFLIIFLALLLFDELVFKKLDLFAHLGEVDFLFPPFVIGKARSSSLQVLRGLEQFLDPFLLLRKSLPKLCVIYHECIVVGILQAGFLRGTVQASKKNVGMTQEFVFRLHTNFRFFQKLVTTYHRSTTIRRWPEERVVTTQLHITAVQRYKELGCKQPLSRGACILKAHVHITTAIC